MPRGRQRRRKAAGADGLVYLSVYLSLWTGEVHFWDASWTPTSSQGCKCGRHCKPKCIPESVKAADAAVRRVRSVKVMADGWYCVRFACAGACQACGWIGLPSDGRSVDDVLSRRHCKIVDSRLNRGYSKVGA